MVVRWQGVVRRIETGVCLVEVPAGLIKASWSGRLLAAVARDRVHEPRPGDRVSLTLWSDGRATVNAVVATAAEETRVVPLRRPG